MASTLYQKPILAKKAPNFVYLYHAILFKFCFPNELLDKKKNEFF